MILSGVVIVAISILMAYVSKRNGVDEQNAIRARTVAWYLFGTLVSQGLDISFFPFQIASVRG